MTKATIQYCNAEEVKDKIGDKDCSCVIDVREVIEFEAEEIPETQNHPLSDFNNQISSIPKNKNLYIVCKSGKRSEQVVHKLADQGWHNIQITRE